MSGTHIVLFNGTAAGMTYRLYSLPKMHSSRAEAEASGGENTLLQIVLFAPNGLDVDFPLTWRPACMHHTHVLDGNFVSIDHVPFVVVTYESTTRLFPLPSFLPTTEYASIAGTEARLPPPEQMLFPKPAIELSYMHKRNYADHVRITSGFESAFMVWLDDDDHWMILPTRYDTHGDSSRSNKISSQPSDPAKPSTSRNFVPRRLGNAERSHYRLCLSPTLGMAFHVRLTDRPRGLVHVWEWSFERSHDCELETQMADPKHVLDVFNGLDLDDEWWM